MKVAVERECVYSIESGYYFSLNPTTLQEYFDYIFPDEAKPQALKILEMAQKWKKQKTGDE